MSKVLTLTTGGSHEFDAVVEDESIVASIKSLSGKTAGGNRPAAKYSSCLAELYFLSLVQAPKRLLVLTTPDFHAMFMRYIEGRLVPGVGIELLRLPDELQAEVDRVSALASGEVSIPPAGDADTEPKSDDDGCREEVLAAAHHLHSNGQADFTPDEIIRHMRAQGSKYTETTIRTHVVSRMCADAPDNHGTRYADFARVARGRYRVKV